VWGVTSGEGARGSARHATHSAVVDVPPAASPGAAHDREPQGRSMPGVHIVTDSACDLSEELAAEHDITIVPLTIRFGDEVFQDRRDLSPSEFWKRCAAGGALPETSAPSPGAFQQAFDDAASAGSDAVVCCTISSGVSATYQSARTAADGFDRIPVEVVDTRSLAMGEGLLAIAAAEDAAAGAHTAAIVAATEDRIARTHVYGAMATLDHLQRGGRVGGAKALVGSLLSIKPVIQVEDGMVAEESKQRTRTRSLDYLVAKVKSDAPLERLAVCNGAADDVDRVLDALGGVEVAHKMLVTELGPVVGTHAGPGTIGVCYLLAEGAPHADH
jgi:DegV family protein with EDD domain